MKIILPTYVDLPRKKGKDKRVYMSFNSAGRLSPFLYNEIKQTIHKIVLNQLPVDFTIPHPCSVVCKSFPSGKRYSDIDNSFMTVKSCNDAMVHGKLLIEDDYRYVKAVEYIYGGNDPINPRYEIEYIPYDESRYQFEDAYEQFEQNNETSRI